LLIRLKVVQKNCWIHLLPGFDISKLFNNIKSIKTIIKLKMQVVKL
jgi:hypothetical protein